MHSKNPIALDTLVDIVLICHFLSRLLSMCIFPSTYSIFLFSFLTFFHCTKTSKGTI